MTEPAESVNGSGSEASTPARDAQLLERTVFEVKRVIVGQDRLVERMLVGLLSRGHLLIEGVPGVAKTLAVMVDHCAACQDEVVGHGHALLRGECQRLT